VQTQGRTRHFRLHQIEEVSRNVSASQSSHAQTRESGCETAERVFVVLERAWRSVPLDSQVVEVGRFKLLHGTLLH